MTQEIDEKAFNELFGDGAFLYLSNHMLKTMMDSPEYGAGKPYIHQFVATTLRTKDKTYHLGVESNLNRIGNGLEDFGIIRLIISDEQMPDEMLDRYNFVKSEKERINRENKNATI